MYKNDSKLNLLKKRLSDFSNQFKMETGKVMVTIQKTLY